MTRRLALLALPLAAAACSRNREARAAYMPTVCVENAAAGVGSIRAAAGYTRWNVLPGQTDCRRVSSGASTIVLRAESLGGGASGPARYQTTVPTGPGCWHWRLTDARGTGGLLQCSEEMTARAATAGTR